MPYDELVRARRIRKEAISKSEVSRALARAERDLRTARHVMAEDWDWGFAIAYDAVLQASRAFAELLFEAVARAYERTSLIITTNLPFEAWTEVLGGERLTGALLDRLTHRVHILEANGESYRLRESTRRHRGRTEPTDERKNA